jgi:hypothetical protein
MAMVDDRLRTPAWLLTGIAGSLPGVLEFAGGRLSFVSEGRAVFNAPLSQVSDISFPWHYFGGGVKFRIGADAYRLSFVEPGEAGDIRGGREAGKLWKRVLSGAG